MTGTLSRPWTIALWVARVLVAIPFFIAAWLEGMSSSEALAEMELVWIPGAPLWLVRGGAAIEGLAALGLILPGVLRLPMVIVTASAMVLLVIQIAALGLDFAAGNLGDLQVKAVVVALTLFILWLRLRPTSATGPQT
ncbi:MAG: DoxX family protein [Tabrizicola sp.]|nr:DoxX family protein [Tabrizicola sp.]